MDKDEREAISFCIQSIDTLLHDLSRMYKIQVVLHERRHARPIKQGNMGFVNADVDNNDPAGLDT